jgi:hypothetical protein
LLDANTDTITVGFVVKSQPATSTANHSTPLYRFDNSSLRQQRLSN